MSGSSNEEQGMFVHVVNYLCFAHALRDMFELLPCMELWWTVDCDGAQDWRGLCLPGAAHTEQVWKVLTGRAQVCGHTVGASLGLQWMWSCPLKGSLGEGRCWLCGSGRRGLWRCWPGKEAGVARVWSSSLIEARARPSPISEEQALLSVLLQSPLILVAMWLKGPGFLKKKLY